LILTGQLVQTGQTFFYNDSQNKLLTLFILAQKTRSHISRMQLSALLRFLILNYINTRSSYLQEWNTDCNRCPLYKGWRRKNSGFFNTYFYFTV